MTATEPAPIRVGTCGYASLDAPDGYLDEELAEVAERGEAAADRDLMYCLFNNIAMYWAVRRLVARL